MSFCFSARGGIPSKCCFNFFGQQIPEAFVLSIQKTHVRCYSKAFVLVCVLLHVTLHVTVCGFMHKFMFSFLVLHRIKTSIGEVCVKQAEWAQAIYNKRSAPSPSPLSKCNELGLSLY